MHDNSKIKDYLGRFGRVAKKNIQKTIDTVSGDVLRSDINDFMETYNGAIISLDQQFEVLLGQVQQHVIETANLFSETSQSIQAFSERQKMLIGQVHELSNALSDLKNSDEMMAQERKAIHIKMSVVTWMSGISLALALVLAGFVIFSL